MKISESPAFQQSQNVGEQAKFPVVEVVRKAWRAILIAFLSMAAANIPFYMATVFALQYGPEHAGMFRDTVLMAVCLASLVQVVTIPIAAVLADRHGRRPVLLAGCAITVLEGFPFFWLMDTGNPTAVVFAMVLALPIAHALTDSPLASFVPELFATRLRYTGSAVGYQVGGMVMSGPVPLISAALFSWAGGAWPLSVYVVLGGLLTFIAVYAARESYRDDIAWSGSGALPRGRTTSPTSALD